MPSSERAPLAPAVRLTLSKQIADTLRREIVQGRIPPGTRLIQDELCKEFGTSRMPVRDALQQLTHEGLLAERAGQREVVPLAESTFAESQELIAVLHGWAARRLAEQGSDDDLAELRALHQQALGAGSPEERAQLGYRFHAAINHLAGAPRLVNLVAQLQQTSPQVFPVEGDDPHSLEKIHGAILEAILARDGDQAETLSRRHALQSTADVLGERPRAAD